MAIVRDCGFKRQSVFYNGDKMGKEGKTPETVELTIQMGNIRKDQFEGPSSVATISTFTLRAAVIFWFATIGYMSLIFYLSSMNDGLPDLPSNFDKVVHAMIYIPLAFLLYISLNRSGITRFLFITAFFLAGIYGITDEFHQSFVPGRDSSVGDIAADFAGAFLGSCGARFFSR